MEWNMHFKIQKKKVFLVAKN